MRFNKINVAIQKYQKAASKNIQEKKLTIDCYYRLLLGFLDTFTIVNKVSFAMTWVTAMQSFCQNPEADLIFLTSSLTSLMNSSITESVILVLELVLVALAIRMRIQLYSRMAKKIMKMQTIVKESRLLRSVVMLVLLLVLLKVLTTMRKRTMRPPNLPETIEGGMMKLTQEIITKR